MKYYLGIDGGGTRTVAAVSDENSNILCRAESGSINFYSVGMDMARDNLSDVIKSIKNQLGDIVFTGAFIGCSALDWEADEDTVKALCDGIIRSDKIRMNSDAYVALKASDCKAVAICGTGSMAIGEIEDGEIIVKGGWGHILGDEGSAYQVAIEAIRHCCYLHDCGDVDDMVFAALDYFGISSVKGIIDVLYSPDTKKDYIAGFCARVSGLAESGCVFANKLIKAEAENYANFTVKLLLEDMDDCSALAVYGGMFEHCYGFYEAFCDALIDGDYPDLNIKMLESPPEEGALKLARAL